jgi:hypothetical protein
MGNIYTYDEKAAYDQRYRYRHSKHTSYSSNSSNASSNSCNDEKCDDCNPNARPFSYPYHNTADGKRVPADGEKKVRFMVEKPLPPGWVMNWNWEVERKRGTDISGRPQDRKRVRREKEEEWWANGGQGLVPYDSDEEDDDDDETKRKRSLKE